MNLPFEDKDKGKRKYNCFVCGVAFSDLFEMNKHILENHEEGREYVSCPACKFCVRDLKAHFKAKHKDRPMPTSGQMKALIWKDMSPNGKTKTRKPNFRDGYLMSIKNGGREMHYRSGLECEIYECLESITEVLKYDVEPLNIPYLYKGKQHKYFPDLSIQFIDGHIEIWEIKPAAQTDLPQNEAKWKAATEFCRARNWEFIVITEVGLGKLKKLARQIVNG